MVEVRGMKNHLENLNWEALFRVAFSILPHVTMQENNYGNNENQNHQHVLSIKF